MNTADVNMIKNQLMELNLSEEDTNLLVSYISKDPERFTPELQDMSTHTLPRNCKRYAFKRLAKLLRKLEEKTVLQLIDDDSDDFYSTLETVGYCKTFFDFYSTLETVGYCKTFFPANRNIQKLYIYLLENWKFTCKVVNAKFEPHKRSLERFAELKKQKKQKQKNLFIRDLSRSYKRIRNIGKTLDVKFSL